MLFCGPWENTVPSVLISFTLDATMEYLFEHIERYGINRHIRIGLAHPIPGEKNLCIKPDQFKDIWLQNCHLICLSL